MRTILEVKDLQVGKFLKSNEGFGNQGFFKVTALGETIAIVKGSDDREIPISNQNMVAFEQELIDADEVATLVKAGQDDLLANAPAAVTQTIKR